jgi:hypothetical protein
MTTSRRCSVFIVCLGVGLACSGARPGFGQAGKPTGLKAVDPQTVVAVDPVSGAALGGLDPVTYHLGGKPLPGLKQHELVHQGVAWHFVNAANRAAFERAPELYRPRLGGYDAHAVSRGRIADADPGLFILQEGRLYVFRTAEGRAAFLADPSLMVKAEQRWPEVARANLP